MVLDLVNGDDGGNDGQLPNVWFLNYKLCIDRVRISWNPSVGHSKVCESNKIDPCITWMNKHDHSADHYHLTAVLLSSSSSSMESVSEDSDDLDQHSGRPKIAVITSDHIQPSLFDKEQNEIHFHSQEIDFRFLSPRTASIGQNEANEEKFGHNNLHPICRITLEHFQNSKCMKRNLIKFSNRSERIGFVDVDLVEELCRHVSPATTPQQSQERSNVPIAFHSTSMILFSGQKRKLNSNGSFCLELSYSVECRPDIAQSLSSTIIATNQQQQNLWEKFNRLKQKLSTKLDVSPNLLRKTEMIYSDPPSKDSAERLWNVFKRFRSLTPTKRLYRISIHFGNLDHMELIGKNHDHLFLEQMAPFWACFEVKQQRQTHFLSPVIQMLSSNLDNGVKHENGLKHSSIVCRTRSHKLIFSRSRNDDQPLAMFDQNYVFYQGFNPDDSPHSCLSIKNERNLFMFKCPLVDFLNQPSVNQYFCLEENLNQNLHYYNRGKCDQPRSYCTLQFSIIIKPVV